MASPPAEPSPSSSQGSFSGITLDALVEYFLASKRSLTAIQHVVRAQEIVVAGREALEENARLAAKNGFVENALNAEVQKLEALAVGIGVLGDEVGAEFEATVKSLDHSDERLKSTLRGLKATPVLACFRPPNEPQKCLFDFIDESGVNNLYNSIKASIDRFDVAQSEFEIIRETFGVEMDQVKETLSRASGDEKHGSSFVSPVPSLFSSLENHATETAGHLEGLVKHYDLCVTAIRHTEGGGEAMMKVSGVGEQDGESGPDASQLVGLGVNFGQFSDDGGLRSPEPISTQDRAAILAVLVKDAREVEDVVAEIKDRLVEMEEQLPSIISYIDQLRTTFGQLQTGLSMVKAVAGHVPDYIAAAADFQGQWEEEKQALIEKAEEVDSSVSIFAGFSGAYDGLIVEAQRRRHVKARMERIMDKAINEIERLHQEDANEREAFRKDQAEYLPVDIWPGLLNAPPRYEFVSVDEEASNLPDIKKSAFEAALNRLRARMQPSLRSS